MIELHELIIPTVIWFAVYLIHYRLGNVSESEEVMTVPKRAKSMPKMYSVSISVAIYLTICLAYLKLHSDQQVHIGNSDLQIIGLGFISMILLHLAVLRDES